MLEKFSNINSISLSCNYTHKQVTDLDVISLIDNQQNLISLTLSGCEQVTDVGVTKILEGCSKLQSLDLEDCRKVTDVGITKIGEGCPQLQRLYLYHKYNVSDNVRKNLKKRQEEISVHTTYEICVFNSLE